MPRRAGPPNAALAEALFALAEREPGPDRRLALLRAGYRAMDAARPLGPRVAAGAPPDVRPLIPPLAALPLLPP